MQKDFPIDPAYSSDSILLKEGDAGQKNNLNSTPNGLICLCFAATAYQLQLDPDQLAAKFGWVDQDVGIKEILFAAKSANLLAQSTVTNWSRFPTTIFPIIAELNNGDFIVLVRFLGEQAIVFDPSRPENALSYSKDDLYKVWSGKAIFIKPKNHYQENSGNKKFGVSWFIPAIVKYKKVLIEVLLAAIVVQVFSIVTPLFSQVIIDKVLLHRSISTLNVLGVGMAIGIIFESILSYLQNHLLSHTVNRIDVVLGSRVVDHLFRLPLRYFETRRVGDTLAHIREIEAIRQFITGSSVTTILDIMFSVIFIGIMFAYSSTLAVIVLLTIPFFAIFSLFVRPQMRKKITEKFDRNAASQAFLVETITGIQTVKALALESVVQRKWENLLSRQIASSFNLVRLANLADCIGQSVQKVLNLTILWVGADLVMKNEISVGQLIAFQMVSTRVIQPIVRLVHLWQDFQQVSISIDRVGDILDAIPEIPPNSANSTRQNLKGNIEIKDLSFRYTSDGGPILNSLCFSVKSGSTVGVVGRSGSGKSTLTKLLQRLYSAESGTIFIDDVDIKLYDPIWLRRQMGIVLQENYLLAGTIGENIAINLQNASRQTIESAARLAGAHDFITEFRLGYDTHVGERGVTLSGGQRQRIAIARALITNPRILIFDEATSALDYESEHAIQKNMSKICANRTVFIIAHRLSTIKNADEIIVIDRGAVLENGSHNELIAKRGLYFDLFSNQDYDSYTEPGGEIVLETAQNLAK